MSNYNHIYIPNLSLYCFDSNSDEIYPKSHDLPILTSVLESHFIPKDSFLMYTKEVQSYRDYFERDTLKLFKEILLTVNSDLHRYLTRFNSIAAQDIPVLANTVMYLCSNGGREVRDAKHTGDKHFYYNIFCKLNRREIGINDNKRLIETLVPEDVVMYSSFSLELVESVFDWLDTEEGHKFIADMKKIELHYQGLKNKSNMLYVLKEKLNGLDLYSPYSFSKAQEVMQFLKDNKEAFNLND